MKKIVRGIVTGTLIGAGVGLAMIMMRNRSGKMATKVANRFGSLSPNAQKSRGTLRMVKDNAMRWTSAVKSGTEAFSQKMARRNS